MPTKEWKAEVDGHTIVLVDSWGLNLGHPRAEARLYIDGQVVDRGTMLFNDGDVPIVRGTFSDQKGNPHTVEGFVRSGFIRVLGKICVDNVQVCGNRF
jgi:hypothetical protein